MDNLYVTDENYNTLESLLDKTGGLNAAIVKSKQFSELRIYEDVMSWTKQLDIFDGIEFKHRFWFLIDKMELHHCKKCGQPSVFFKKCQKRFSLCRHHNVDSNSIGRILSEAKGKKTRDFIEKLKDKSLLLAESDYKRALDELAHKKENYAFIVTKNELQDFYHDLIIKTERIVPITPGDLMISKRLYISCNGISAEPKCRFCGKNKVTFINRIRGYADSCPDCAKIKSDMTRSESIRKCIDRNFNFEKYEIVEYPKLLNYDVMTIKCRKCGYVSNVAANNGKIEYLRETPLCEHCEKKAGWEETEFHDFLKKVYGNKIIRGPGGRKIIPPYELDNYLPDKNIAFEYDGIYWHSEANGKNSRYHSMKTDMCEKNGIRLIHVFSSEWLFKKEITMSRIKHILGIFDKTIYARKCTIKTIGKDESKPFQDANHIQGYARSNVSLGLYHGGELVSIMTFGKCRFDKKHEWEMVRFCNKLGYNIPGAASKLLKRFEADYKPKSLVTYADRRWSDGALYKTLNFKMSHISNPNYWYFKKTTAKLYSRINFQKHKLKEKLEIFDPLKSEAENMKANGYSRIFDCGNMVFEKTY